MKNINHLAVLVSVIVHQILGFIWYTPAPWAATRVTALGLPLSELSQVDGVAIGLDIAGWILASYVFAWLANKIGADTAAEGAKLGFLLWLGIGLSAIIPHYAFAHIPAVVMVIDAANFLVALLLTGVIIGAWRKKPAMA